MESFNNPIIKKVQEKNIPYKDANASKIRRVVREAAKEQGVKVLGTGIVESIVFEAEDPNKVIALRHSPNLLLKKESGYNKPETLTKKKFYIHKILSILFPDSFPKIHSAFIHDGDEIHGVISGTVREKVLKGRQPKVPSYNSRRIFYDEYSESDYQPEPTADENLINNQNEKFQNILKTLETVGIHIGLDTHGYNNFIFDKNKSLKYLDMVDNLASISSNANEKLLEYMKDAHYPQNEIQTVQNAITRIVELEKEDKEKPKS